MSWITHFLPDRYTVRTGRWQNGCFEVAFSHILTLQQLMPMLNHDTAVDSFGGRVRAPFRCVWCGQRITVKQFIVRRSCSECATDHFPSHWRNFSGPRELVNRNDPNFIPVDAWANEVEGLESHYDDGEF